MRRLIVVAAVGALAGCAVAKQEAPGFSGPSELGLSLEVTATPDIITQDGKSASTILIVARDAQSQPVAGLTLRAETSVNGALVDFGVLSSRTVSTAADGRAVLSYLAPPPPPATVTSDTIVAVVVTPTGSNFANSLPRSVTIRLARPGIILPPNGSPVPVFFFSPTLPKAHENILFDGSQSADDGQIVNHFWNYGDGATDTGVSVVHSFDIPGTYNVVLTVTDNQGLSTASAPKPVLVSQATAPTASFTISPTDPIAGVTAVQFNGQASLPSPGHFIESLEWDFGDGSPHVFGETTSHTYTTPGTYTVVLVVTDSTGQKNVASKTVTVANP